MQPAKAMAVLLVGALAGDVVSATQQVTYTYDALGRLTTVSILQGPGSGVIQSYQYDAAGNRLQYQVTAPGQRPAALTTPDSVVNATAEGTALTVSVDDPLASGTVTFTENGVFLGSAPIIEGQASLTVENFPTGQHSIQASYSGDTTRAPQQTSFEVRVQNLSWLPKVLEILLSDKPIVDQ